MVSAVVAGVRTGWAAVRKSTALGGRAAAGGAALAFVLLAVLAALGGRAPQAPDAAPEARPGPLTALQPGPPESTPSATDAPRAAAPPPSATSTPLPARPLTTAAPTAAPAAAPTSPPPATADRREHVLTRVCRALLLDDDALLPRALCEHDPLADDPLPDLGEILPEMPVRDSNNS